MAYEQRKINFAVAGVAKMTHSANVKYRIPETLKQELAIIKAVLRDETIVLETPFAHIIDRDHNLEAGANSCRRAGCGWSIDLAFWWKLKYPAEVQQQARLPNNKCGKYISINILEMVCVVINLVAFIYFCHIDGLDMDTFLVLLNWCNSTSACLWIN